MAIRMNKKTSKVKKVVKKTPKTKAKKAQSKLVTDFKLPNSKYTEAIGRRKTASARVRIYEGSGDLVVNQELIADYFSNIRNAAAIYMQPFNLTGTKGKFALSVQVSGSGKRAQLDAVVHGIASALVKQNPELRTFLKPANLLTRDDRMKETRKVGRGGKARRKRQSPKR
jgi:small subunit ribosomal protein S9